MHFSPIAIRQMFIISLISLLLNIALRRQQGQVVAAQWENFIVDWSPLHASVKRVVGNQSRSATSSMETLSVPPSSVMFTYTTHYTFPLIPLLYRSMHVGNISQEVRKLLIVVCLDKRSYAQCEGHRHSSNCVNVTMPLELPKSDFMRGAYHYITWLKHEMLFEILKHAQHVLFFDADMIMLRNPWPELSFGRRDSGEKFEATYDLQFQRDGGSRGGGLGCSGIINSGQMWVRNSTKMQVYFGLMWAKRPQILLGQGTTDQDFIKGAANQAGLTLCSMPPHLYTGKCFGSRKGSAMLINIITHHATCLEGTQEKRKYLLSILQMIEDKVDIEMRFATNTFANGSLVGAKNSKEIWFVENGKRRPIQDWDTFVALKLDASQVRSFSAEELEEMPLGQMLTPSSTV